MRIGLGVPTFGFAGGVEQHAFDLARSLGARGHRVTLLYGERRGRDPNIFRGAFADAQPHHAARARELDVAYLHKASDVAELESLKGVPLLIAAHAHRLTC